MKTVLNVLALISLLSFASYAQTTTDLTPDKMNTEFFKLYGTKGLESSLQYIFETNKFISAGDVDNVKTKLAEQTQQMGKYHGYELIARKSIGRYVLYSFLIRYERQAIRFVLTYYKPDTKWKFNGFEYDDQLSTELKEAATA
ncbi:MAG: hypothetical protein QM762_25455 [Chryseolinea sp.]